MKRAWKLWCSFMTPECATVIIVVMVIAFFVACAVIWDLTTLKDYQRLWK